MGWRGRYFSLFALPDRWISWWPDAVRLGLRIIKEQQIDVIWSTYPIMTAHLIGLSLSRLTGLPWIADFRDPMRPSNATWLNRRACTWLEKQAITKAACSVFTTPGARRLYAKRFSDKKLEVIPNGFEEKVFEEISRSKREPRHPFTLVHSGLLYRRGRTPLPFFRALALLKARGRIDKDKLQVTLRASGYEPEYRQKLGHFGLTDIVNLAPPVSYADALQEQAAADGLLLFQGSEFNAQIPAKIYDYLRLGLPIFALTDSSGDTAALLNKIGGACVASISNEEAIANSFDVFLSRLEQGTAEVPEASRVMGYSRRASGRHLADVLDRVKQSNQSQGV
jgi:hypothetical protein